jgi:hypothetical protein
MGPGWVARNAPVGLARMLSERGRVVLAKRLELGN